MLYVYVKLYLYMYLSTRWARLTLLYIPDHCETNREAYNDIAPVLRDLARLIGKRPKDLVIYDPYYCNGYVPFLLTNLTYSNRHFRLFLLLL